MRGFVRSIVVAGVLAVATGAQADSSVSGKFSAHSTASAVAIGPTSSPLGQATIVKGKKKRAVEVEVVLTDRSANADALMALARINGVEIEPGLASRPTVPQCNNTLGNCTLGAIFWGDIDALEAANPGQFVNQPLVITVEGNTGSTTGVAALTIRSQLVKK